MNPSQELTLAFSFEGLNSLSDPRSVTQDARTWAEELALFTRYPAVVEQDFIAQKKLHIRITAATRDPETALEETRQLIPTPRHVLIGTNTEHQSWAEETGWEYLPLEDAASKANWDTTPESDFEFPNAYEIAD